jgi:hypothetical protein
MHAFRPCFLADRRRLTPDLVAPIVADLTGAAHFFVRAPLELTWHHVPNEEVYWELFLGRALDRTQTRRRQRFAAWNVHLLDGHGEPSNEPLISVRHDAAAGVVFVTRAVLCHCHERYDAGGNVIETRETVRWQRELVGTIRLEAYATCGEFADELACLLFEAVVGTSRLPLTSLEAPLPAFALGQFGYIYRPDAKRRMREPGDLLTLLSDQPLAEIERVKLTELFLRATDADTLAVAIPVLLDRHTGDPFARLREMFNGVTLSPYTDFAAKALAVPRLARLGGVASAAEVADFLTWLLRHLAHHLTAYDLVTFHHRGANYPDALLIDDVLRELRPLADGTPELLGEGQRLRRRGLRQALLLREEYRDHPVPDAPTSPGENARVLPEPFARVPDEHIFAPMMRRRRLFTDDLAGDRERLRDLLRDLDDPRELVDLGTALFLDRPLGGWKQPGEPDQTLLMAHVLFSRSVALRRLQQLARRPSLFPDVAAVERWTVQLQVLSVPGIGLVPGGPTPRPGVVSLQDAFRAADDWLILRTPRRTIEGLIRQYNLGAALHGDDAARWHVVVPVSAGSGWSFRVFDKNFRPMCELRPSHSRGYVTRGEEELLAGGLVLSRRAGDAAEEPWA